MNTEMQTSVSIVLADDHELLREGLKTTFRKIKNLKLLAEAANGIQLLEAVAKYLPDIVITDIVMPRMTGIEATRRIRKEYPSTRVIALSNYDEEEMITEMIEAGADGYLLKNASKKEITEALAMVQSGQSYYCSGTSKKLLETIKKKVPASSPKVSFTRRELEVMQLLCQGLKNKEVAKQLGISSRTVETHRQSIQEKLNVKSAVEIALYAKEHGII